MWDMGVLGTIPHTAYMMGFHETKPTHSTCARTAQHSHLVTEIHTQDRYARDCKGNLGSDVIELDQPIS